jgi:hypothetical protein
MMGDMLGVLMADIFGNGLKMRGCFFHLKKMTMAGRGAYLQFQPGGGLLPQAGGVDPYLVTGVSFQQRDRVHIVQCFNNANHVYAFGHDPASSMIKVAYTSFLTNAAGSAPSQAIPDMLSTYNANRVSVNQNYARLVIGGSTLKGFVTELGATTMDASYNLQSFEFTLLATEVLGT